MKSILALLTGSGLAIACSLAIHSPPPTAPLQELWKQNTLSSTERIDPVWVTVEEVKENNVLVRESLLRTESAAQPPPPIQRVQKSPTDKLIPRFEENPVW